MKRFPRASVLAFDVTIEKELENDHLETDSQSGLYGKK